MLEVQNLYRSFRGIPAIESVTFEMALGENVRPPNGDPGQSTTVKLNIGILRVDVMLPTLEGVLAQRVQQRDTRSIAKENVTVAQLCHV